MYRIYTRFFVVLFFCCGQFAGKLWAQQKNASTEALSLHDRIATASHDLSLLATVVAKTWDTAGSCQLYVQLHSPLSPRPDGQAVFTIQDHLANSWMLIRFLQPPTRQQLERNAIKAWSTVHVADKISPYLLAQYEVGNEEQDVLIALDSSLSAAQLADFMTSRSLRLSPQQLWKDQGLIQTSLPLDEVHRLAASPYVRYIGPVLIPEAVAYQAKGFTNTQPARQPLNVGGHNLTGQGVTIGVGDDSDPYHVDFDDRLSSFNPLLATTHGFHTTGTVGGAGLKDPLMEGYAPASHLISDFFSQVIANSATYHQDFDMDITSNSYGVLLHSCSYAGTYDLYAQFLDQQMRDYPELLHVFAAANDGNMTCGPYPLGFATLTGAFATSKNALTVGSNGKTRDILSLFSSRGPTKDGRLKPEIIAMGTRLFSTIDHNNYELNSGTSMACPNVAGAAGLLYQRYNQMNGGQDPKSALIKAVLMNGADDLGNPGPDFRFGFGLMNMGHALRMLDSNRYFINTINTGQTQNATIQVPPNTAQARVMLYWNDPAAAPLAAQTLINNLNLEVLTPANATVLPWVLDPDPAMVNNNAVRGVDNINNVEQVTLNQPAAGAYTIKVHGANIPDVDQEYILVYDFIPEGIRMQYPFGGEQLPNTDSMIIYWEASPGNQSFNLAFSSDNGANWQPIQNNIAGDQRALIWFLPAGISSNECLVRVTRSGETSTSKKFTMCGRPQAVLAPEAEQCPGSIRMSWNAVPGAQAYKVFKKQGAAMQEIATVTNLNYTFYGLDPTETYWVSVAPVINGSTGIRAIALEAMPNTGSCAAVTPGDLHLLSLEQPGSGRLATSNALTSNEPLVLTLQNQDDAPASHYRISYRVNEGAWQSQDMTTVIPPTGTLQLEVGSLDFSSIGAYQVAVAVTNLQVNDPVKANDSLTAVFRQLSNPPIDLSEGYEEGFEGVSLAAHMGSALMGLPGADRWDFTASQSKGRVRNFVTSEISIDGVQSMSLDNAGNQRHDIEGSSFNTLTGTFNLDEYATPEDEVRCEFEYLMHGVPKFDTGNQVWLRGSDTDPWLPLFTYQIDSNNLGMVHNSGSLSLSDFLSAAGQQFSSSTQVRFGQYDTSMISTTYFGNGLTFDKVQLYTVTDDAQLLGFDDVFHYNCGLSDQVPLTIKVRNGVLHTIYDIQVSYQLNGQAIITETIDSIPGKDTLTFTFPQTMNLSNIGTHQLSAWVYVATDTYRLNDSLLDLRIINQPVINSFPYLQDFEDNDGYFFTEGNQSSWTYGSPAAPKINHAASGQKAWKTNLEGSYNNRELSYLYSPCFDISALQHPMLSFHLATDIELPGESVYDVAYVEYSNDGRTWQRLGAAGEGTNWYQNDSAQAWTQPDETYWHVATIPLPTAEPIISFRFVLWTDQGASLEGVALDDIHIYDLEYPIFDEEKFVAPISHDLTAMQEVNYLEQNKLALSINSPTSLAGVSAQAYKHAHFINADSSQYFLPKNFVIQSNSTLSDSLTVRFYIPDEAMRLIREDGTCYSCSQVVEVQQLGITQYADEDKSKENNLLGDNLNGTYHFIPREQLSWVPYDKGYYATVKLGSFSEYWFNDGGPTQDQHIAADLFNFTAAHQGNEAALLEWQSSLNTRMVNYHLQRADTSLQFATIATVAASGSDERVYTYTDLPVLGQSPSVFYRIQYELENGASGLSLIRRLDWDGRAGRVIVYPNPVTEGSLTIDWIKGNHETLEWALFSSLGQRVNYGKIEAPYYSGQSRLNLNQLAMVKGIYILKIKSGKEHWEFKIVYL